VRGGWASAWDECMRECVGDAGKKDTEGKKESVTRGKVRRRGWRGWWRVERKGTITRCERCGRDYEVGSVIGRLRRRHSRRCCRFCRVRTENGAMGGWEDGRM